MANFFCDFENGLDANDGTTFANRWKTWTSGATAARIAPGDVIRCIASPAPTSIGNVLWTRKNRDSALPATVNISSSTNATPIQITTSAAHDLATGDIVQIRGRTGANAYENGNWVVTVVNTTQFTLDGSVAVGAGGSGGTTRKYNTRALKLTTSVNKKIDMCEVNWTASTNVSSSTVTTRKQGDAAVQIIIGSAFTTGKAAYRTLPAAIDLSAYEQVTLWIASSATLSSGVITIRLCSDTVGDTTVDTLSFPAISNANALFPLTINKGSALGSNINSIALYVETDQGSVTLNIDCIVAVKAASANDSLGLQSLIGKNTATETFSPIASIEDQVICLDCGRDWSAANVSMGYWGTTETVDTYKVEPLKLPEQNGGDIGLTVQDSGSSGSPLTYSGGWDRTNMSTQNGFTWIDGRNCTTNGISATDRSWFNLEKIGLVRCAIGLTNYGMVDVNLSDFHCNGMNGVGMNISRARFTFANVFACHNFSSGINLPGGNTGTDEINFGNGLKKVNCNGASNSAYGLYVNGSRVSAGIISELCGNNISEYQGGLGLGGSGHLVVDEITNLSDNAGGLILLGGSATIGKITNMDGNNQGFIYRGGGEVRIHEGNSSNHPNLLKNGDSNFQNISPTFIRARRWISTDTVVNGFDKSGNSRFSVDRWGDVVDDHRVFVPGGEIRSEATVRHTASGIAWRFAPTSTIFITSTWPLEMPIAHIFCEANKQVTVKAWVRRNNTELTIGVKAKKKQLAGMTNEVSATITAAIDTWEEITIQFTPTENGVVEIEAFAYGGTTRFGYIDDLTIQQAA